MLQVFVAMICVAAGVGDARVLTCAPVVRAMPAAECALRVKRAQEMAVKDESLHVEARCVTPGDPV